MIIKTNDYTPDFLTESEKSNITMFNDLVKLDRGNLICIAARPGMKKNIACDSYGIGICKEEL